MLPKALQVLQAAEAPSPEAAAARDTLAEWVAGGALRRDGDADGSYDAAAAVGLMDAWWEPLIRAVYDPVLGDVAPRSALGFHNAPGSGGSAFQDGFYGQVWTDLSMVLGDPVRAPTSQVYCGSSTAGVDGTLTACAERLWSSLASVAGTEPNDGSGERILFLPTAALSMHWVNRPTTQHIAMFGRLGGPAAAPPAPARPGAGGALPATGPAAGVGLGALVLLTLLAAVALRRRRAGASPG